MVYIPSRERGKRHPKTLLIFNDIIRKNEFFVLFSISVIVYLVYTVQYRKFSSGLPFTKLPVVLRLKHYTAFIDLMFLIADFIAMPLRQSAVRSRSQRWQEINV